MKDVCSSRCRASMRGDRRRRFQVACAAMLLLVAPGVAQADGIFTPFVGASFGNDQSDKVRTAGLSLAAMAGGVFGFELDFGRTGTTSTASSFLVDSRITTVTGNIILGVPIKAVRPYALAGLGWIRTEAGVSVGAITKSDGLGIDVGAGLMGFFTERVGARVDLRYFRTVSTGDNFLDFELEDTSYWRWSVGLALRF